VAQFNQTTGSCTTALPRVSKRGGRALQVGMRGQQLRNCAGLIHTRYRLIVKEAQDQQTTHPGMLSLVLPDRLGWHRPYPDEREPTQTSATRADRREPRQSLLNR
jgi:hypothetical protein